MKMALKLNRITFILLLTLLFISYYLEHVMQLSPCPLCYMQRLCLFIMSVLGATELVLYRDRFIKRLVLGMWFVSCVSLYFVGRQVWLLNLPDAKKAACLPGLQFMVKNNFPFSQVLQSLLVGSSDCASVSLRLLGQPLAYWSLLGLLLVFGLISARLIRK